jgi:uncharacterized membrane protein
VDQEHAVTAALERTIGRVLRAGTVTSSVFLALGLAMAIAGADNVFTRLLPSTGVIILMATPAARVVVSFVDYVRQRDWVFVTLTAIVLLTLGGSVIAAFW